MWSPEREAEAPTGGDPAGLLPPEWEEDEERMSFLFSAFKRSREVNSTDWDSKMGFWAPLVLSHSRRQGVVRLRLRDLQEAFQRKGSVPLGLATVLQDLLRRGELQRESDFMASVDSSWISWGVGVFLLKPLKWTLSNMLGDNKVPAEEVLVAVELLKLSDGLPCAAHALMPQRGHWGHGPAVASWSVRRLLACLSHSLDRMARCSTPFLRDTLSSFASPLAHTRELQQIRSPRSAAWGLPALLEKIQTQVPFMGPHTDCRMIRVALGRAQVLSAIFLSSHMSSSLEQWRGSYASFDTVDELLFKMSDFLEFVYMMLQEKAEEVYRLYQNSPLSSHPVVALSELSTLCANSCPDERTFYLVLLQLQKEKRVTVLEQNGEKIVKFARGPHAKVSPVNDVDVGVYQLMQSEQLLSRKVESLSQEAERCKEEARRACRAGKKQLALRSLKAKQRTEKRIEALHAKLDTVQGILDRIYASQTDQMVFNAYQAGVGALKLSMKDVTVEKAESLVDQIQELCDTQDEVSQTLAGGVTNGLDFDSEELEKELDILLQDTTKEPLDLPDNRRDRHFINSVPNPRISDAQLEAELEKLSLSEGGMELFSKASGGHAAFWLTESVGLSPVSQFARVPEPCRELRVCFYRDSVP
ncbi:Charged multivesicular body protein 7 [Saguinus oedipus]|nr:Charged multivesicular body protein 7 [Saguinus oedipus]